MATTPLLLEPGETTRNERSFSLLALEEAIIRESVLVEDPPSPRARGSSSFGAQISDRFHIRTLGNPPTEITRVALEKIHKKMFRKTTLELMGWGWRALRENSSPRGYRTYITIFSITSFLLCSFILASISFAALNIIEAFNYTKGGDSKITKFAMGIQWIIEGLLVFYIFHRMLSLLAQLGLPYAANELFNRAIEEKDLNKADQLFLYDKQV